MQKFLVVGCGGSGGEVLARMMDQLQSQLSAVGISELPAGWQFVHVDVPVGPDTNIDGIGHVRDQGGRYIGTAPPSGRYPVLDQAISARLQQEEALSEFVTWAPRSPEDIHTPIARGAGQMRAVGRVITLNNAENVRDGLTSAVRALSTTEANASLDSVSRRLPGAGSFDPAFRPLVLVVSSMAGGAGASMALDVCRILSQINGVSAADTAVFMVTPDIFPGHLAGVNPNALAMFGELIAAQTGSGGGHDGRILSALGQGTATGTEGPFARVFPVSRFQGTRESAFGDGTQQAVYRGLARGLSALMSSGTASASFSAYDLTNRDTQPPSRAHIGWGTATDKPLTWGAFGFGSLSMGRDRYRHYAAQRLARTAADRLRNGHIQVGNQAGSMQQLHSLIDSQWANILDSTALPADIDRAPNSVTGWFTSVAAPKEWSSGTVREILASNFVEQVPQAAGQNGQAWVQTVQNFLGQKRGQLAQNAEAAAYQWAFEWSKDLERSVTRMVSDSIAQFGLPYAREIVQRLRSYLGDHVVRALERVAAAPNEDLGRMPEQLGQEVAATKGTIVAGQKLQDRLIDHVRVLLTRHLYSRSSALAAQVLVAFASDVLGGLERALDSSSSALETEQRRPASKVGLANVSTDVYAAWPSDDDVSVPERFATAENEVLLTPSDRFARLYEAHLPASLPGAGAHPPAFAQASVAGAGFVISGQWPVGEGESAPGGLLRQESAWNPALFTRDPRSGNALTPSLPRYAISVEPKSILDRAMAFVSRSNEAFDRFCSASLAGYVLGHDGAEAHEVASRRADLISKFKQTLVRALPLSSVDPDVVSSIHGRQVSYRYKFSSVPFGDDDELVNEVEQALKADPMNDPECAEIFERALVDGQDTAGITRLDIFGSYENFSPLAFGGVLGPVAKQWKSLAHDGQREEFWSHRRARPLPASLPMVDEERRALIAGWYVAQLTGRLRIPDRRNLNTPVQVFDAERGSWVAFPHPLLTPPERFIGSTYDWLPAVLESVLVAMANSHHEPVLSALRPYQVLRSIYDSTEQGPKRGISVLSAEDNFADWLRTGETASGDLSRSHADDLEGRYANAAEFLEKVGKFAAGRVSPSRQGGQAGQSNPVISREAGRTTPFFNDLAEDIVTVTADLTSVLAEAKEHALTGSNGLQPDDPDAELGNF